MSARDVFVCHAHLDKETHARPLAWALGREGISCWVDEGQILPGDSLVKAVNEGLAGAKQVVLLITERFLGRSWTEREMEAATSLEIETGETLVIPVLAVARSKLLKHYPLLAPKFALDWRSGPEEIAGAIAKRFGRHVANDWVFEHPIEHVGAIWTRVTPSRNRWGQAHELTLRWGPFIWRGSVSPNDTPVSLTHHKELPDRVPLHVEVNPPAIVTVGQGVPPDAAMVDIDEGWQRVAGWSLSPEDRSS